MSIPEQHFDVWSMDSIYRLPSSQVYNTIYTSIDNLLIFLRLITCFKSEGALSAPERANLSFSSIVRLFGVPKMVLHNHD